MKRAIYPGSFDPLTYGHIDIIKRACHLFDEVIVTIAINKEKNPLFTIKERICIIENEFEGNEKVKVIAWEGLSVECAQKYDATFIVRGLRIVTDFEYEFQISLTNKALNEEIESVYFMTRPENSYTSSSIVKEVHSLGGDVSRFVTPKVIEVMNKKKECNK